MPSPTPLALTEHVPEGPPPTGPLVVLVHGSLDRSSSFGRVLRRLSDLHTVVYDRRGYHRSREVAPFDGTLEGHIDDLLEVVDGRPAVVIGHSYGGAVTLGAALRPGPASSIRSIAVYEPPMPWLDLWPKRPAASSGGRDASVSTSGDSGAGEDDYGLAAERFFRRMVGDAAWDRLPAAEKAARRADGPALAAELDAIRITEPPFDVTAMAIPSLCGRGELSAPRHRESVAWLVGHMPGAAVVEFAGASHGAHLTHPDAFAAMVRRTVDLAGPGSAMGQAPSMAPGVTT
jgi:pimeloyl-ACP methyl ester carboxylesterase